MSRRNGKKGSFSKGDSMMVASSVYTPTCVRMPDLGYQRESRHVVKTTKHYLNQLYQ